MSGCVYVFFSSMFKMSPEANGPLYRSGVGVLKVTYVPFILLFIYIVADIRLYC